MRNIGDKIIYKNEVCTIEEILPNFLNNTDYYRLTPLRDKNLLMSVPANSKSIKNVLSKEEAEELINRIPEVDAITDDPKNIENHFKELFKSDNNLDLIRIIKTTYNKPNEISIDNKYFSKAENLLYNSLSIALNIPFEECKKNILQKMEE